MRTRENESPVPYRLVDDGRKVLRYAFWGVDRPKVIDELLGILDDCAARPLMFDFSTTYMSAPLYNGNISVLVYPDQADYLKELFSSRWIEEAMRAKRILDRHSGFFKSTYDKHWVYRFKGSLSTYAGGMKEFSGYLTEHGVQLARICAEVCQVGTGYGLEIEGTLRAPIMTTDQDKILNCMRLLQSGAVNSMASINFKVDSPMSLDPGRLPSL